VGLRAPAGQPGSYRMAGLQRKGVIPHDRLGGRRFAWAHDLALEARRAWSSPIWRTAAGPAAREDRVLLGRPDCARDSVWAAAPRVLTGSRSGEVVRELQPRVV